MNIEDSIEVSVNTEYLAEQSIPEEDRFVFAYHIRIHNSGDNGATLRSRPLVYRRRQCRCARSTRRRRCR